MFIVVYNKEQSNENTVNIELTNNNDNLEINGDLVVYGVDSDGLSKIGTISPDNSSSFTLNISAWSIRLVIADL